MALSVLDEHIGAHVAELFRAFSDTSRVRIMSALLDSEKNVSTLAGLVGITEIGCFPSHPRTAADASCRHAARWQRSVLPYRGRTYHCTFSTGNSAHNRKIGRKSSPIIMIERILVTLLISLCVVSLLHFSSLPKSTSGLTRMPCEDVISPEGICLFYSLVRIYDG